MKVEYWGVGNNISSPLDMTIPEISAHLLADWVPSLPVSVSSSFVGWPPFLTELVTFEDNDHITLREEAGRSERQWKGVLSWMIGVAGARHVLAKEGYRWIAPVSAFYPNLRKEVDLTAWHTSFPRGVIEANGAPGSKVRLRPDYLALRQLSGGATLEWAVVEAKGTDDCLTNLKSCPLDWHAQARNIELDVSGSKIAIPRHLVIATRANPNAVRSTTRRIQIRAWNSDKQPTDPLLPENAVVDIATAHLFGFFRNLRMHETAKALAYSVQNREETRNHFQRPTNKIKELLSSAEKELAEKAKSESTGNNSMTSANCTMETDFGNVYVEIDEATMSLTRTLLSPESSDHIQDQLVKTDNSLKTRDKQREDKKVEDAVIELPCGVRITYPSEIFIKDRFNSGSKQNHSTQREYSKKS